MAQAPLFPHLSFYAHGALRPAKKTGAPQMSLFYHPDYERYTLVKKRQTPSWADRRIMRVFYSTAQRLTRETGILHVVDHIVPLTGGIVCGFNSHHNMRVCRWDANLSKGARWWPDMPTDQLEFAL